MAAVRLFFLVLHIVTFPNVHRRATPRPPSGDFQISVQKTGFKCWGTQMLLLDFVYAFFPMDPNAIRFIKPCLGQPLVVARGHKLCHRGMTIHIDVRHGATTKTLGHESVKLVGGFNPSENINWKSSPNRVKITHIWNHTSKWFLTLHFCP